MFQKKGGDSRARINLPKEKMSFNDTCFFCKERGHQESECEFKQTFEKMKALEEKFK